MKGLLTPDEQVLEESFAPFISAPQQAAASRRYDRKQSHGHTYRVMTVRLRDLVLVACRSVASTASLSHRDP